jgi:predicted PurR-regulated permease PerM
MSTTTLRRRPDEDAGAFTREKLQVGVLLVATALASAACLYFTSPFIPALTWALALAVITWPVYRRIARRLRKPDLAAGLSVVLIAIVLIAPVVLIGAQIVNQALEGVQTFQQQVQSGEWRTRAEANPQIAGILHWIEQHADLRGGAVGLMDAVRNRLGNWVKGTAWTLIQFGVALFSLFFFFRDRREVLGAVRSLIPLSNSEVDEVFDRVASMIRATVFGNILTSLAQGTLGGLMFWILGIPAPALWGLVMFFTSLIPSLGAPVVWVPAAAMLAAQGHWGKAAILTAWGAFAVGMIDNVLYPILVGREIRMHTLAVFIAVVGGMFVWGASGLVLGPVALALLLALIDILRRRTAHGRSAEEPT